METNVRTRMCIYVCAHVCACVCVCAYVCITGSRCYTAETLTEHCKSTIVEKIKIFFYLFVFSRAAPMAYGGSQARDPIRVVATSLH